VSRTDGWRHGLFVAALAAALAAGEAGAQEPASRFAVTDAQLLMTFGPPGEHEARWTATLQHFSTWRHGSNFFFLDLTDGPGLDFYEGRPGLYLEYSPVLSLGSLGVPLPSLGGALRDVGVTAQVNAGWTPDPFPIDRVILEGIELAWSVPGFAVFNSQLLARQERGFDPAWQLTLAYNLPVTAGPLHGAVSGFADLWRRDSDPVGGYNVLLAQPQILATLGSTAPGESHLELGAELQPSYNFPAPGLSDGWHLAVSPMLRWVF
jgi:hypothetical protein